MSTSTAYQSLPTQAVRAAGQGLTTLVHTQQLVRGILGRSPAQCVGAAFSLQASIQTLLGMQRSIHDELTCANVYSPCGATTSTTMTALLVSGISLVRNAPLALHGYTRAGARLTKLSRADRAVAVAGDVLAIAELSYQLYQSRRVWVPILRERAEFVKLTAPLELERLRNRLPWRKGH